MATDKQIREALGPFALGTEYLNKKEFYAAVNDPKHHRSLPYTLDDIQFQIRESLKKGMTPERVFEVYKKTDQREWMTIINHSIIQAVEKQMEKTGA